MKLSDLEKVWGLKSERDYLLALRDCAGSGYATLTVKGLGRGHDLRPDIVEGVKPALIAVVDQAVVKVDRDLAALGVVIQGED